MSAYAPLCQEYRSPHIVFQPNLQCFMTLQGRALWDCYSKHDKVHSLLRFYSSILILYHDTAQYVVFPEDALVYDPPKEGGNPINWILSYILSLLSRLY